MEKPKQLKAKKCRACNFPFHPRVSTQVVCSPLCALKLNKINKSKAYDRETKRLKTNIKTRGNYTGEAQKSINSYVRFRDRKDNCISCGRGGGCQFHAGHFISIGANCSLRFNLLNINKQCAQCNKWRGGKPIPYRINLIKKIGLVRVEFLEGPHDALNYSISDLKRIKWIFDMKLKRLKAKLNE